MSSESPEGNGDPSSVFCKGSYSAPNDEVLAAKDVVIATAGEFELTMGELQMYYWQEVSGFLNQYGSYAGYYGLDLTVAGHAHGGQWRWRGQGLFAPGQGLFPKLTDGLYEERLLVSRGLSNPCGIPRFGNPPQLVTVTLAPNAEYTKSL